MGNLNALPALDVRTPTPPDALSEFARVAQIRSSMQAQQAQAQEMQVRQQQIKDQQATTAAMQNWDPSTGDYDGLAKSVLQNGGSANAATAIQQHGIQVKQATQGLQKGELDNYLSRQKATADMLQPLTDANIVPDEQLQKKSLDTVVGLVNNKLLDPAHGQQYAMTIQQTNDPTALRNTISQLVKTTQGAAATAAQAKTAAETAEASGKARESNAAAVIKEIEAKGLQGITPEYINQTAQDPITRQAALAALQRGDLEGAKDALKSGFQNALGIQKDIATATNPQIQAGKVAVATAEGQARANVEAQMARGSNAALANVPPHLIGPASTAATKAGEDYAQSQSVSDRLQAMMDAAKKGNVVSYQLIPQEGALQVTTSQGVHRINMAEIQNYGGGSLWQRNGRTHREAINGSVYSR